MHRWTNEQTNEQTNKQTFMHTGTEESSGDLGICFLLDFSGSSHRHFYALCIVCEYMQYICSWTGVKGTDRIHGKSSRGDDRRTITHHESIYVEYWFVCCSYGYVLLDDYDCRCRYWHFYHHHRYHYHYY